MAQHYHREVDWMGNLISFADIGIILVFIGGYFWMLWLFRAIVHIARNYPSENAFENAFKTAFEDLFRWRTYTGRFAVINAILVLGFCLVYFKAVF